nr:MFS transporter [Candidatus Sigynarchaeota archaeon]
MASPESSKNESPIEPSGQGNPEAPYVPENTSTARSIIPGFVSWVLGICILSFGTQFYTEIEGNWLNSYMFYYVSGESELAVSLMVGTSAILGTICFIIWGFVSDNLQTRLGRRVPVLLVGLLGTAIFMILTMLTTSYILVFLLVGILMAITSNMFHMGNKVIVPDLIPKERRGRVNMLILIGSTAASVPIWVMSMVLLPDGEAYSLDIHLMFMLAAIFVLIATSITTLVLLKEPKVEYPRISLRSFFSVEMFRKNRSFFILFVATMFIIMSQNAYLPYLLILLQEIDIEIEELFIALPIVGGCVGFAVIFAMKFIDKIGRKKIVLPCLVIAPIGGIILSFFGNDKWGLITGFAIMMPFVTVSQLGIDTWTQDLLPAEARGKFIGIIRIGNAIGKAVGVGFAAVLATQFGILWIFMAAGIVLWISIPVFLKVPETLFSKEKRLE